MATIAHLIPRFFEEKLRNDTVSEVALLAFFLLDGIVYIFHSQVGIGKLGVTVETVLAGEGSFAGRRRAGCQVNNRAQEKQDSRGKEYTASFRWHHFTFQYEFRHSVVLQGHVLRVWQEIHIQADMEYWSTGYFRLRIVDFWIEESRNYNNLHSEI